MICISFSFSSMSIRSIDVLVAKKVPVTYILEVHMELKYLFKKEPITALEKKIDQSLLLLHFFVAIKQENKKENQTPFN